MTVPAVDARNTDTFWKMTTSPKNWSWCSFRRSTAEARVLALVRGGLDANAIGCDDGDFDRVHRGIADQSAEKQGDGERKRDIESRAFEQERREAETGDV